MKFWSWYLQYWQRYLEIFKFICHFAAALQLQCPCLKPTIFRSTTGTAEHYHQLNGRLLLPAFCTGRPQADIPTNELTKTIFCSRRPLQASQAQAQLQKPSPLLTWLLPCWKWWAAKTYDQNKMFLLRQLHYFFCLYVLTTTW